MLAGLPHILPGKRDRALLALWSAGAFRRSELIALQLASLAFETEGVRVYIRHSKTDQEEGSHQTMSDEPATEFGASRTTINPVRL